MMRSELPHLESVKKGPPAFSREEVPRITTYLDSHYEGARIAGKSQTDDGLDANRAGGKSNLKSAPAPTERAAIPKKDKQR